MFLNEYIDENYITKKPEHFNFAFDVVDRFAIEEPEKKALVWCDDNNSEKILTFSELAKQVNKTANVLKSLGIKKGDSVMLMLRRRYEFWYMLLALHKIRAIAVPATIQLLPSDITYRIEKAGIKMIIALNEDNVISHIEDSICELKEKYFDNRKVPQLMLANGNKDGWINFERLFENASSDFADSRCSENEDICILYFTSGTSGYPKMVSHNYFYPLGHIVTAKCWQNVKENGLHLSLAETGWAKALWGKIYGQWLCGCGVFVYDMDSFVPNKILDNIQNYKVTSFCAPPTAYRYLLREDLSKYDLSNLSQCTTAGEALTQDIFDNFKEKTGLTLREGYGQTELTLTAGTFPWVEVKFGSMGKASPNYDLDVIRPDGSSCDFDEVGEIVVRIDKSRPLGMFAGYFEDEERTKIAFENGIYHTGDSGRKDKDGYFWFEGRTDDMIKSSGFRISPFEVESVLLNHPAVFECAVTGVQDDKRGQIVKATIVVKEGFKPCRDLGREIKLFAKKNTANYKTPRLIEFVDELPKTHSGKICRVEIREKK
ncbi:MAG: AMP-binding protein [Spirochaetaceae bacterium]|nr:AMP-binding protein [Spirochaetaceae bacterium]